jgi:hypothetical protein
MARIVSGPDKGFSGKVGGLVYSQQGGETYVRTAPHRSKNSWSPRQQLHRVRFKAVHDYCAKYKYTLIPQIWNLAAEHGHGFNLFLKANMPAFALDGQLLEIEKLHFSDGKLPLPMQFKAKRLDGDPSKVEATWLNDENLSGIYTHDELMIVAGYSDHFSSPVATGVHRKAGHAIISLPDDYPEITRVWLFFAAYNRKAYSPDQFFSI